MPRGRFLNRSIALSEQLAGLSLRGEVLFYRILPHTDVDGRVLGSPFKVKAGCVPMRDDFTTAVVAETLAELHETGLIVRYTVGGIQCIWYPRFDEHQQGLRRDREGKSTIPAPPPDVIAAWVERFGAKPDNSGVGPGALPEYSSTDVKDEAEVEVEGQAQEQGTTAAASAQTRESPWPLTVPEGDWPAHARESVRAMYEATPPDRWPAWRATIRAMHEGDDVPAIPADVLATAILDWVGKGQHAKTNASLQYFRVFVRGVLKERAELAVGSTRSPPTRQLSRPTGQGNMIEALHRVGKRVASEEGA